MAFGAKIVDAVVTWSCGVCMWKWAVARSGVSGAVVAANELFTCLRKLMSRPKRRSSAEEALVDAIRWDSPDIGVVCGGCGVRPLDWAATIWGCVPSLSLRHCGLCIRMVVSTNALSVSRWWLAACGVRWLDWPMSSKYLHTASVWRTFPDLYRWQVTTLWVNYPLWVSQLGQLSLSSLPVR